MSDPADVLSCATAVLDAPVKWSRRSENRRLPADDRRVPLTYRFGGPAANHAFLSGHRIMVQIPSTWFAFALYDRNAQSFVPSMFFAPPAAYRAAEQRADHAVATTASAVELPLVVPSLQPWTCCGRTLVDGPCDVPPFDFGGYPGISHST